MLFGPLELWTHEVEAFVEVNRLHLPIFFWRGKPIARLL